MSWPMLRPLRLSGAEVPSPVLPTSLLWPHLPFPFHQQASLHGNKRTRPTMPSVTAAKTDTGGGGESLGE